MIVPLKTELCPKITAPFTCQKTFSNLAPLISTTFEDAVVDRAPSILIIKTAAGLFCASKVKKPSNVEAAPIDDGTIGALDDIRSVALRSYLRGSRNHLAAGWARDRERRNEPRRAKRDGDFRRCKGSRCQRRTGADAPATRLRTPCFHGCRPGTLNSISPSACAADALCMSYSARNSTRRFSGA